MVTSAHQLRNGLLWMLGEEEEGEGEFLGI